MTPVGDYRGGYDVQPLSPRRRLNLIALIVLISAIRFGWVVFFYSVNFWAHINFLDMSSPGLLLIFAKVM